MAGHPSTRLNSASTATSRTVMAFTAVAMTQPETSKPSRATCSTPGATYSQLPPLVAGPGTTLAVFSSSTTRCQPAGSQVGGLARTYGFGALLTVGEIVGVAVGGARAGPAGVAGVR